MITEFQIFESKQVGIIYHFTSIYTLYNILSEREPSLRPMGVTICCTRNFDMKSKELKLEKQCCRITLDGNKISNNYKITPYIHTGWNESARTLYGEEREERITINGRLNLNKYALRIDILNNPPIIDYYPKHLFGGINTYTFEPNQYLQNKDEIKKYYNEFKNKIKELNLSIPIFFVNKMIPIGNIGVLPYNV